MYDVGVHGEASIITIAMSFWSRKPKYAATGRKIPARTTSFISDAAIVGLIFASAFLPSNVAPIEISASGEAITARLFIVLSIILGKFIFKNDAARPKKIPIIIGFLSIFISACLIRLLSPKFSLLLLSNVKIITANIL